MRATDPPRGNIPLASRREQSVAAPTRELVESPCCRLFRQGPPHKADLRLVDDGGTRWIVKDFRRKSRRVRWIGRVLIARESRAYRVVGRIEGLPRFAGRVDAHALAVEYVEAVPLAFAPDRARDGPRKLARLREIVERMHSAGVVHCDLRGRDNVLVGRDGRLWIVDLASAVHLRPGGLRHRLSFRWLRQIDHAALLKWKRIVEAGPFTRDEQALLRRFRTLRPLWLHRRRAWRAGAGPSA